MPEPSTEVPKSEFLEIDGPAEIPEGQNFFNQEPFQSIIQEVSLKSRVDEESLRRLLLRYGRKFGPTSPESSTAASRMMQTPMYHKVSKRITRDMSGPGRINEVTTATAELGKLLSCVPDWTKYIGSAFAANYYDLDGTFRKRNPEDFFVPPRSYGAWMEKRQKSVTIGIEEIFPQDFARETPAVSEPPHSVLGKAPQNRHWRIRKQIA